AGPASAVDSGVIPRYSNGLHFPATRSGSSGGTNASPQISRETSEHQPARPEPQPRGQIGVEDPSQESQARACEREAYERRGRQAGPRGQEGNLAQDGGQPPEVPTGQDGQPDGGESFLRASSTRFRHSSAASPTGTRSVRPVLRSRSSTTPSLRPFSPTVTRSGIPMRSASLNLPPGRSSRSSIRVSIPHPLRFA